MIINPIIHESSGKSMDIFSKKVLNKILSDNCGKPIKQVEKDTDRDYWMKANDAVKYGIVDKIL